MDQWKYGQYTFTQNPASASETIEFVGDILKTASGRLIVQPTAYKRDLSLEAIFYQPLDAIIEKYNVGYDYLSIVATENIVYALLNNAIHVYNTNLVLLRTLNLTGLVGTPLSLAFDSVSLWLVTNLDSSEHYLYEISPVDGSIGESYHYTSALSSIVGLTYYGDFPSGYLIKLRADGVLEQIDPLSGNVINFYNGLQDYLGSYTSLAGGKSDDKIIYVVKDGRQILLFDLMRNKVIDIVTLIDEVSVSFSDMSWWPGTDNLFFGILKGLKQVVKFRLNTVEKDVYYLTQEVCSGKVILVNEYNNTVQFLPAGFNIERLADFYKAYRISLEGTILE